MTREMRQHQVALKWLQQAVGMLEQAGMCGMDAEYFMPRVRKYLKSQGVKP